MWHSLNNGRVMDKRFLLTLAILAAACRDAVSPRPHELGAPALAVTAASGITLDQQNGAFHDVMPWSNGGSHVGMGFNPQNPHVGDAIVATFFWIGTTNTITIVTDHLSDGAQTPVGNTYTLVDYVTSAGISMATYVATNVRGFRDASTATDSILTVHALFSTPIPDGGVLISAWSGVSLVDAEALGTHLSASGSGSAPTIADPGAIPVNAGALAFGVTMSDRVVGLGTPPGFTTVNEADDPQMKGDAEYVVQGDAAGAAEPQWTWFFDQASSPGTWLATALTLNPAATHLVFSVQPSTTLPFTRIEPAVQAAVVDDQGNPLTSFTGSVSITIGHNGGLLLRGTLSGTKTVPVVNGVATFSDLSIDQVGNGYTLVVSVPGATSAESAPFNIGLF